MYIHFYTFLYTGTSTIVSSSWWLNFVCCHFQEEVSIGPRIKEHTIIIICGNQHESQWGVFCSHFVGISMLFMDIL